VSNEASDLRPPVFEITLLSWEYGLRLAGELDALTSPALAEALRELDRDEPIVLDVEELTFIDSTGLHALVSFSQSFSADKPLVLSNPSEAVRRMFELVRLNDLPGIQVRLDDASGDASR
jgi:anti-anti-sigma factor